MKFDTYQIYQSRILKVLVHIQNHLDGKLPLEELARVANFSPYHFHRIFSGMVGESVKEHVRRLRLERAAQRLARAETPITTVAFDSGYESHEAFTRAFHAMFNMSPSEFREARRPPAYDRDDQRVHWMPDGALTVFEPHHGLAPVEAQVTYLDPIRVCFSRNVGPYAEVAATWQVLMQWAWPRGLVRPGTRVLGIVHDDPEITPPEKIRYDACIEIHEEIQPEGNVGVQNIPGGRYAVATHRGPYDLLGTTYAGLCGEWLAKSGHEPASSPAFEVYNNASDETSPEELLTDIYLPIQQT